MKMKYRVEIDIDKPIDEVMDAFANRTNDKLWMQGFVEKIPITGDEGELGAKCKLVFQIGKRRMEMIEEITAKRLPDKYITTYTTPSVFNKVENSFKKIDDNTTLYRTVQEFQFKTLMMRAMSFFMPGAFKKQTQRHQQAFKSFVENI